MRKLFIILVALVSFSVNAQNDKAYVDGLVAEFTQSLNERAIDNYFYNTRYCLGNIQIFDLGNGKRCMSKDTYYEVYVFWKEDNVSMIKKIDNCGLYFPEALPENDIVKFYKSSTEQLREKVKNYETVEQPTGPVQRTAIHNCYREFEFVSGSENFGQKYNEFDLTNDSQNANINFSHNNSLVVVSLDSQIDSIIKKTANKLKRQP